MDNGNPNYSSQDGVLYNKLKTQIIQCPTVKTGSFSIPVSVTSIENSAFSGCSGLTSITIPSSVTSIGNYAFYYCNGLTSITIPASVISIGEQAFYRCGLINVDNGNPNYSSQDGVFYDKLKTQIIQCPTVKTGSFSIPASVTSIGNYAFYNCSELTLITLPSSVNSIGKYAFYGCAGLKLITIPASATTIESYAFYNCTSLTSIYSNPITPVDLTNKYSVFYNINKSTCTLYVPQGSKAAYQAANQWKDFTNIVENIATVSRTLQVNTAGTLASLLTANELATVTNLTITGTIDARDFVTLRDAMPVLAALDISRVTIAAYDGTAGPANVKANMTPAISEPEKAELNDDPLRHISAQHIKMQIKTAVTTTYPANEIPQFAFYSPTTGIGKLSLKSIILPNSTTSIGSDAFDSCNGLTSITIPSLVNTIGTLAFYGCTGLTSVTIPASVSSIGSWAFGYCSGLTSITIPSSVIAIGSYGFYNCSGLSSITIPASVTSIGERAFDRCGLINVDNGNPNYSSQDGVLYNKLKTQLIQCPTLKTGSFIISSSVTTIGNYAFNICSGLTSITIPSSVRSVGNYAFANCLGLTTITIPASVISIGEGAFYSCGLINVDNGNPNYSSQDGVLYDKMKTQIIQCPTVKTGSFSISASVTSIGNYAFSYCTGLTTIAIPASVTSIGNYAFYSCTGLTSITIPASVSTIGSYAFYYCTGLTSIYANPTTPVDLSNQYNVFYNINKSTCTLYVPQGSKAAYQAANQWKDFTNIVDNTATVSKTLQVNTAGTLASLLTANELATITNLTLTGTIDARDFVTLRDAMPVLAALDISGVSIAAYDGTAGPSNVKANMTPAISEPEKPELVDDLLHSISPQHLRTQIKTAVTTTYPANEIPTYSFYNPTTGSRKLSLKSILLPNSTTSIGSYAFRYCTGLTSITIPASVSSIGSSAFNNCTGLRTIAIPVSVTSIGSSAFESCTGLTSISIPTSVTSIGDYAFGWCTNLATINIPNSVKTIGSFALSTTAITSISIPASVTSIGDMNFYQCKNLPAINVDNNNPNYCSVDGVLFNKDKTSLIEYPNGKQTLSYSIPQSVTKVLARAFDGVNSYLQTITIPEGVTDCGRWAFMNLNNLNTINIPSTLISINGELTSSSKLDKIEVAANSPYFKSVDGILFNYNLTTLIKSPVSLASSAYTIPTTVSSIESMAFLNCAGLTTVKIPESVKAIGWIAFSNCSNLKNVYAYTPTPLSVSATGLSEVGKNSATLYVPLGSKALYQVANEWKDFTNIVEFTTATPTVNDDSIRIYPNPVIDHFSITGVEGTSDVKLTDLNGKMLISKQVSMNENVSISNLPKGMYLIQLINNGNIYYKKIIKK